jgi:hypothetical protein
MKTCVFWIIALVASIASADDFKTVNGKEYKDATVTHVEPDGIVIKFHGGIVKLAFTELPEETRIKYGYHAHTAQASKAPQAAQARTNNQTEAEARAIEKWNAEANRIDQGRTRSNNVSSYTLQQFEMSQFYLVGETIIADFSYRVANPQRIDREWFEGYIWRYDPNALLRESYEGVRVLFPKEGLAWYQSLPTKSTDVVTLSVFAQVEDNGSSGTFLRLLGTQIRRDKDGIQEIVW